MGAEEFWGICGGISFYVWGYYEKNALIANIHAGSCIFVLKITPLCDSNVVRDSNSRLQLTIRLA